MRVSAGLDISASPEQIWAVITDAETCARILHGVTRFEREGDQVEGPGTRYRIIIRVGSAEIGSRVEVVEWDEPRDLTWSSISGLDQRVRWRLRPRPGGRTHVEVRIAYGVAGAGLLGWVAERAGAAQVGRHFRKSLLALKRQVEEERRAAR